MAFAVRLVEVKRLRGNYDRIARLTFRGNVIKIIERIISFVTIFTKMKVKVYFPEDIFFWFENIL